MQIIPLAQHASNLDPSARVVAEDHSNCDWVIYAVTGGFVLTLRDGRAVDGLFPTQAAAQQAVTHAIGATT
jgi:hypothetical protein